MSKITLVGCYAYYNNAGGDLFEHLQLPSELDKETLTNNIILKGSEFEVIYANPELLKVAIGIWSDVNSATFTRWVNALNIEYAPLENYDRHESWTDNRESSGTGESTSTGTSSNTTEQTKSAFDSSTYQPDSKVEVSGEAEDNTTSSTSGTDDLEHTGRIHGNIGVTTSQQMLEAELNLGYWNVYERITQLFLQEFTIPVYV